MYFFQMIQNFRAIKGLCKIFSTAVLRPKAVVSAISKYRMCNLHYNNLTQSFDTTSSPIYINKTGIVDSLFTLVFNKGVISVETKYDKTKGILNCNTFWFQISKLFLSLLLLYIYMYYMLYFQTACRFIKTCTILIVCYVCLYHLQRFSPALK